MVKCSKCNVGLTEDNWFPSFKRNKKKLCKDCHNNYQKEWRKHSSSYKERLQEYRERNREKLRIIAKGQRIKRRRRVLEIVGRGHIQCKRCGCNDIRVLEINHVNADGRSETSGRSAIFVNKILNGSRSVDDLEILCKPCNSIHYIEHKYPDLEGRLIVVWTLEV